MKVQFVLPLTLVVSVALLGIMKIREKEVENENRQNKFQDIKVRVTEDILQDYQSDVAETRNLLERTQSEQKALNEEVNALQAKADEEKLNSETCQGNQKSATDEMALAEMELQNLKAEFEKEITNMRNELDTLKQQQAERSPVCGFLKPGSQVASCGNEAIAEAPKPEEPKAEAPKPEEPKAEAPKPEEPKVEAPKPEEPKVEAPKPEEPKVEAPKAEEPKVEAPKAEEPKAEAPKKR